MNIIRSIFLWTIGTAFFLGAFFILAASLMTRSRTRTFELARQVFSILIRIMGIDIAVKGRENIQSDQTYLIMGNHQSLFDLFVIPAAIPLVFTAVEAAYHFSIPVWGYLIRKWGCIPIRRNDLVQAKKSLEQAAQTLDGGVSIAVLPEGHRTRTGKIGPFKKGPFHLARATRATILPFGISGLYEYQQRGGFQIRPGRVRVEIGKPIPFDAYENLSVEGLRDLVFNAIGQLARDVR